MKPEMMTPCPSCGKALRKDNSRGACSDCIESGRAPAAPATNLTVNRRFRAAAKALGFNPDKLEDLWRRQWLKEHAK